MTAYTMNNVEEQRCVTSIFYSNKSADLLAHQRIGSERRH